MAKILLVEDNDLNRDMLSCQLRRKGHEVLTAEDGAVGVALANSEAPDIIFMDMNMPVMDGWEATQAVKANPATAAIPVIALTANAVANDREKALAAGCDDYDTKPIDLTRLLVKMEKLLSSY